MGVDSGVLSVADFDNVDRMTSGSPPPAVKPSFKRNDRYNVMHVDFGDIRVADLYNDLRF